MVRQTDWLGEKMLGFVQNWFAPKPHPIGVDFGSDTIRLAQVQRDGAGEFRLVAAASAEVPLHIRNNLSARLSFFTETVRDLLAHGRFSGRAAVLSMPASLMHIQHLRLARMDDEAIRKALAWEARGKLPIDPDHALMRHLVAGEIEHDGEPKCEVILMAAPRESVMQLLNAASKARLDVVGMNMEPQALVDCFAHLHHRENDTESITMFVDIGCVATRTVIAAGDQIRFARTIPIGGDHFNRAAADQMNMGLQDAKLLRIKLCGVRSAEGAPLEVEIAVGEKRGSEFTLREYRHSPFDSVEGVPVTEMEEAALITTVERRAANPIACELVQAYPSELRAQVKPMEKACRETVTKLAEELGLCRRYYDGTFPNQPVGRMVFVGGEARQRSLCQAIARQIGLAAQIGDPMMPLAKIAPLPIDSGIELDRPQPSWAVAIGLSMGPRPAKASAGV